MDLSDKTVLVTAGASGIGWAISKAFVSAGAHVHICDVSKDALRAAENETPKISSTLADVSNLDHVDKVYGDIETLHGRLDVVVNNVGIAGPTAALEDIDPEDWTHLSEPSDYDVGIEHWTRSAQCPRSTSICFL